MKRKVVMALLSCVLCVTSVAGSVYGAGIGADTSLYAVNGSISLGSGASSITIHANSGQSLVGKKFRLYKIFHSENAVGGESINYTFNEVYKKAIQNVIGPVLKKAPTDITEYEAVDYIQTLNTNRVEGAQTEQKAEGNNSQFRSFIETLRTEIVNQGCTGNEVTVTSVGAYGNVEITGLEEGYYIVDEVTENTGTHSASSLCMVSTANPTADIHIKSDYPTVEKKIKEDDHKEMIGNDGWNDIADFELGQYVPYQFTSYVPNMNGYESYYFAWHDIMAPELTLKEKSFKIVITEGSKTYQLLPSEFNVLLNEPGVTFKVEVPNLKSIVDREFNHLDTQNHNQYGQRITLNYQAYLNQEAANQTGRPGFENDVRLEFSNDPDVNGKGKTGFTPWDTVACFTYQLNIKKTNNHDLPLENAEFQLYYDAQCQERLFVKQGTNCYTVIGRDICEGLIPGDYVIMKTDAKGEIVVKGLDQGTYYLKEIKAPAGYRKIEDPIVVTVKPSFTANRNSYTKGDGATDRALSGLEVSAHMKHFLDGAYKETTQNLTTNLEEGSGNLVVINHVGSKLPATGSNMTVVLLASGVGLVLLAKMIPVKKKEKGHER